MLEHELLPCEGSRSLRVGLFRKEGSLDVSYSLTSDPSDPARGHQPKQGHQTLGVLPDDVERLTAQVNEVLELLGGLIPAIDDIGHVRGQHKRRTVSIATR